MIPAALDVNPRRREQLGGRFSLDLGKSLLSAGKIDVASLARVERLATASGESLVALLPKLGLIAERELAAHLASSLDLPRSDAKKLPREATLPRDVGLRYLREARVLPLVEAEERLRLIMADPLDHFAIEAIRELWPGPINIEVGEASLIADTIGRLHHPGDGAREDQEDRATAEDVEPDVARLKDLASEAPVIRLVNQLITEAVGRRASDIHMECTEAGLRLRHRIDGVLQEAPAPPAQHRAAVISRLKIMAKLNIAERRLPQDGRIKLVVKGTPIDLRVSTTPSLHGEGLVLRILDRDSIALDFATLGIAGKVRERLGQALAAPNGIFLVTGPTGSGKTTTLYASLVSLNSPERKIQSVEDPIEYQLEGINQVQVKPSIGLSFATVLRSFLRQDPDILMVGEVRDKETAEIAVQAALTGHLVLSTLHTNDAAGAVVRLRDMGIDDYLLTSSLIGVMAQRLVRRLCPECRRPDPLTRSLVSQYGIAPDAGATFYKAEGCTACDGSGYRGRQCLAEVLLLSDDLRRLVMRQASAGDIHRQAVVEGMLPMFQDGLEKAANGLTTLDEVLRVTKEA